MLLLRKMFCFSFSMLNREDKLRNVRTDDVDAAAAAGRGNGFDGLFAEGCGGVGFGFECGGAWDGGVGEGDVFGDGHDLGHDSTEA